MKYLIRILIILAWAISTPVIATQHVYQGLFKDVTVVSGEESCADLFNPSEYTVRLFLVGVNGLTSVLFFEDERRGGWLEGRRFVGTYDYVDIFAEETIIEDNLRFEVVSRGTVDPEVLLVDIDVVAYDRASNAEYCRVIGKYTGLKY